MSLYTPVFPSFQSKSNGPQKDSPPLTSSPAPKKQQNYSELLRDVHLFLSTQNDVLSPPSRSNSPAFDHRVQKLREAVQVIFDVAGGEPANGMWTHLSQVLKMGCVRGRHWSLSEYDQGPLEEDTEWILPDEEEEWIEWERKRQEIRRLKGKMKASQQIPSVHSSIALDPSHSNRAHSAALVRSEDPLLAGSQIQVVSSTTLLKAKEKVRNWQATMASDVSPDTANFSPASTSVGAKQAIVIAKVLGQQRSHSLGFPVVKRAAPTTAKPSKGHVGRPAVPGPSQDHGRPEGSRGLSNTPNPPIDQVAAAAPDAIGTVRSEAPLKASLVTHDMPKVTDFPETSYLPPSFPSHLETSTPLPQAKSAVLVRAKPPPILPLPPSSSTPPPSTPSVRSIGDRAHIQGEPHAANLSSPLPLQIDALQPIKRPRSFSLSQDDIQQGSTVAPSAKKSRATPQSRSLPLTPPPASKCSTSILPDGASQRKERVGMPASALPSTWDLNVGAAPSHRNDVDPLETALIAPLVHEDDLSGQDLPEKLPSPPKSTKSFFSTPNSNHSNSPISNHNLLLHSPVSPMLSFAQNPNVFLPQYTSTQLGQNPPRHTNSGILGMGFNSQFDVEKHVDRVSEWLEKDIDFDGWLRDAPSVEGIEASRDQ
ncbi:hypothetical protein PAXRUDRAFT_828839 [Paxillus rubicundulus Ve08.2h10]|uniref:Uncharacterized protein n=1 Tax=Paxillus rubicundulus Ve08.2h10 TaxID=930991 RepID=A0A0D0E0T9_9AGAM|nr:hypothetical protein PAXRUDRAFT_828839 [Paxillus rubicundulus Ve08.2h10]